MLDYINNMYYLIEVRLDQEKKGPISKSAVLMIIYKTDLER
jgi:hypothetical protein